LGTFDKSLYEMTTYVRWYMHFLPCIQTSTKCLISTRSAKYWQRHR